MAEFVEEFDSSDDEAAPASAATTFQNDGSFLEMMLAQQQAAQQEQMQQMPDDLEVVMGFSGGFGASAKAPTSAPVQPPPNHPLWQTLTVEQASAGAPLAKWLSDALSEGKENKWSRNKTAAAIKEGEVRVNGEVTGANRKIIAGDVVTVHAVPPCTLTEEAIVSLVMQRKEAKMARDFGLADRLHKELTAAGNPNAHCNRTVNPNPNHAGGRISDREGKWSTNDGRAGVIEGYVYVAPAAGAASGSAGGGSAAGGGSGAAGGGEKAPRMDEAERRRLKNKKKREMRERKDKDGEAKRQKTVPDDEPGAGAEEAV